MTQRGVMIAAFAILVGVTSSGAAQDVPEPPVPSTAIPIDVIDLMIAPDVREAEAAARAAELQQWMDAFADWQEWSAQWRNRPEPGWTGFRERRAKPAPPTWLTHRCIAVFDETDPLMPACMRLAEWREDDGTTQIRQVRVVTVSKEEAPPRTSWWSHIHADLLWPAMQWQASIYGVVGMHVSTTVRGRWQVFTAPGVLLLNVPGRSGARVWKVATNYGIGYRLLDFTFPGKRPAELHVNLAKTWMLSDMEDAIVGRSIDVVGFSITFKKSR